MTAGEAARKAGYNSIQPNVIGSQLRSRKIVQDRITELQERKIKITDEAVMSSLKRRLRLTEFAEANIGDFVDENGELKFDKKAKSAGAVEEYSVRPTQYGVSKTIKLRDPIASIKELNLMTREYETQVNNDNRVLNVFVVDKETKELIEKVKDRTQKLIEG